MMRIHSDRAIPVKSNECPGKRSRDNGNVDESGVGIVAEVQGGQVEEVQDQNELSPVEVSTDEEHDEGEL